MSSVFKITHFDLWFETNGQVNQFKDFDWNRMHLSYMIKDCRSNKNKAKYCLIKRDKIWRLFELI